MSNLTDALHAFVQASRDAANVECHQRTGSHQERCNRILAQAGERYVAALRDMQEQAIRDHLARMRHLPADLYEALNSHD